MGGPDVGATPGMPTSLIGGSGSGGGSGDGGASAPPLATLARFAEVWAAARRQASGGAVLGMKRVREF